MSGKTGKCFEKDGNGNTIIKWPTDMYKGTASLPERRMDSMLLDLVLETKERVLGKKFKLIENELNYPSPGDLLRRYTSFSTSGCATYETFGSYYHGYRHLMFNIRNFNSSLVAYEHRRKLDAMFVVPEYKSDGKYEIAQLELVLGKGAEFNLLPSTIHRTTIHEHDANEITGYAKDNIGRYLTSF